MMKRSTLPTLALAFASAASFAAPAWTCGSLAARNELVPEVNALYGKLPYAFTNGNASAAASTASTLTDGTIQMNTAVGVMQIKNNSRIFYKLSDDPAGVDLQNVRITSCWQDTGRSQIQVGSVAVKTAASNGEWVFFANSSLTGATSAKTYQAVFADAGGTPIAEGVTDLLIDFGPTQRSNGVGYTEIEAETVHGDVYVTLETPHPAAYGSVSFSPAGDNGRYPQHTDVTITATPAADSQFYCWFGDGIPAGHEFDNPLVMPMRNNFRIYPIFSGPWRWSGNVMSDGYWSVTTTVSGDAMTLKGHSSLIPSPIMDFRKPIVGTDAIPTTVANSFLKNNATLREVRLCDTITSIGVDSFRAMSSLTNIVLSANLASIGRLAFYNDPALKNVTPFLPNSLTTMGDQIFQFCSALKKGLVVSNPNFKTMESNNFANSGVTAADFSQSGLTEIKNAFPNDTSLTNAVFPASLAMISGGAFEGCTALKSTWFESKPATIHDNTFKGVKSTARVVIYENDADWMGYLAGGTFTPWASLTAATQATYAFADKCKPIGTAKIGANSATVFIATRRKRIPGTHLFMR